METRKKDIVRLSISLPSDIHSELGRIAEKKKVSLAWVAREAIERYVDGQTPLFSTALSQRNEVSNGE